MPVITHIDIILIPTQHLQMRSVAAEQKTVLDLAVASHLDLPICMGSDSESYQMNHGRTLLALQWLHVLHHQITVFVLLHCNLFKKKK